MGTGALIVRQGLVTPSHIVGGGQELGRRAGSENIIGILGFAAAAAASHAALASFAELAAWRDGMEKALRASFDDVVVFRGRGAAFGQYQLFCFIRLALRDIGHGLRFGWHFRQRWIGPVPAARCRAVMCLTPWGLRTISRKRCCALVSVGHRKPRTQKN